MTSKNQQEGRIDAQQSKKASTVGNLSPNGKESSETPDKSTMENVENIKMSEETKSLIRVRAQLHEIYAVVCDITNKNNDENFPQFSELAQELDKQLLQIISKSIEVQTDISDFTQF